MALAHIFIDPSLNSDTGTGTLVDPFGDTEYGIKQTTFNTSGGTQVNIKSGVPEYPVANLGLACLNTDVTPAWAPGIFAPMIFRGYAAAANDGGVAEFDGQGVSNYIFQMSSSYIFWQDIKAGNVGSAAAVLRWLTRGGVYNCELHTGNNRLTLFSGQNIIEKCYIHDGGLYGIDIQSGVVVNNRVANCQIGINQNNTAPLLVYRNIVKCAAGALRAISLNTDGNAIQNAVYSEAGGTGAGIGLGLEEQVGVVAGNIVQGFDGVGGRGFDFLSDSTAISYGRNSVYDCTTPFVDPVRIITDLGGNETLASAPFVDPDNWDFRTVSGVGSLREGGYPAGFHV